MAIVGVLRAAGVGAAAARGALNWILSDPKSSGLARTNFRGREVTLAGGPALAIGATTGAVAGAPGLRAKAAALAAGGVSGAVGYYDDVAGRHQSAKGFAGHLSALRDGKVTTGLIKIAGVGAAGLVASSLLGSKHSGARAAADVLLGAGVIAGMANLVNLLDLRPGRALKAGLAIGAPLAVSPRGGVAAGTLGASGALLPADLGEEIMLGDAGANALGALLGVALATRTGTAGRLLALTVLAGLTAASERVSFTQVIADTPWLRAADELGRQPAA
jgi:UDP-N-acetylmuramyl pentapeptide phosphotransferase/UDP-N-acetylglucosamine-1-phosphate transferase